MIDILVAGGGPAGLAAAIAAAQEGARVVVLEPRSLPIDKACGEGVMAGGVEALRALGVELSGRTLPGIRYRDAVDRDLVAEGAFGNAPALGVRRTKLHAALVRRARALSVEIERTRVRSFENDEHGVCVDGLHARWLVGADGLHSQVRRSLGVELAPRRRARLGLRRHFAIEPWCDRVEVHFGAHVEGYVTPVADGVVGVAFLFEKDSVTARWDELLESFPLLHARLANARVASAVRGAGPFEQRVRRRVVKSTLLVGDAAGYLDPLTGEGVALGIQSAVLGVECIARGVDYESRYAELVRRPNLLTAALLRVAASDIAKRALLHAARALPKAFDEVLAMVAQPGSRTHHVDSSAVA